MSLRDMTAVCGLAPACNHTMKSSEAPRALDPERRRPVTTAAEPEVVMLYDGLCAFCNRGVQTILRYDRKGTIRFAALQSDYAKGVMERHPHLRGLDTVVVLERQGANGHERVFTHSDAALRLARYLGGRWNVARVAGILPGPIRDWGYKVFARYRYRLFGKHETCLLPAPGVRARFLDAA